MTDAELAKIEERALLTLEATKMVVNAARVVGEKKWAEAIAAGVVEMIERERADKACKMPSASNPRLLSETQRNALKRILSNLFARGFDHGRHVEGSVGVTDIGDGWVQDVVNALYPPNEAER